MNQQESELPVKDRCCTDLFYLVIFVIFMISWFGIGCYAFIYGDVRALLAPTDSYDRKCGLDDEVINEPYLVYLNTQRREAIASLDPTNCIGPEDKCKTPQVCRKECPSSNWFWKPSENHTLDDIQKNIICETGIDVNAHSEEELRSLSEANKCANRLHESTPFLYRCVPKTMPVESTNITISKSIANGFEKFMRELPSIERFLQDLISTSGLTLIMTVSNFASCLFYVIFLRWLVYPIVFLSIIIVCLVVIVISTIFYSHYTGIEEGAAYNLVGFIICIIILVLIISMVLYLMAKIRFGCQLIIEVNKVVTSIPSSLLLPLSVLFLDLATVVYTIIVGLHLYEIDSLGTWQNILMFLIHILGFVWFFNFIGVLGEMILATTFATWYWTLDKTHVPFFTVVISTWKTMRYHLGSAALSSLMITFGNVVQCVVAYGGYSYNPIRFFIALSTGFALKWIEKLFKFMNRQAYIMCAVRGKGLLSSASDAAALMLRNNLRVCLLNDIITWMISLGAFFVTPPIYAMTLYFTRALFGIESWLVPSFAGIIVTSFVSNVFSAVYVVAGNAIILCFLEDCERNDGSLRRPYYASPRLRKLLYKDTESHLRIV